MALINLVMNVIIIKILLPIAKFHPCTPQIRRRRQTNKSLHQIHFIFINYVESINYFCDDETACDAYTFNSYKSLFPAPALQLDTDTIHCNGALSCKDPINSALLMLAFLLLFTFLFICNVSELYVSKSSKIHHIDEALDIIEEKRRNNINTPEVVYVENGIYSPIELNSYHSNVYFVAANDTIISGGLAIDSTWTKQTNNNGVWTTNISLPSNYSVSNDPLKFPKQLWIDNKRRNKTRTDILHWIGAIEPGWGLVYNKSDIDPNWNLLAPGIVVYVYAQWTVSLHCIKYHNPNNQTIIFQQPADLPFTQFIKASQKRYYIEGIPEMALSQNSGQWKASFDNIKNPKSIQLYYVPFENEIFPPNTKNNTIYMEHPWIYKPVISILNVPNVTFEGFTFQYSSFLCPTAPAKCDGYNSQFLSKSEIPGAIVIKNSKNITIKQSNIQNIGSFAIFMQNSLQSHIVSNNLSDIGGGGIYFNAGCNESSIFDNFLSTTSFIFRQAPGIGGGNSANVSIEHNEITNVVSNAINIAGVNDVSPFLVINKNYIHHIGRSDKWGISDYAMIYLPFMNASIGTAQVTNNKLHDIVSVVYGGNGIYLDYGASDIFVYGNLVYNVAGYVFYWNYEQSEPPPPHKVPVPPIIVQNNIFILSGPGASMCEGNWILPNNTFERGMLWNTPSPYIGNGSFINNINYIVKQNGYRFFSGYSNVTWFKNSHFDQNIYYAQNGNHSVYFPKLNTASYQMISLQEWQNNAKQDIHSFIQDPMFNNVEKCQFALSSNSSAFEDIDFKPLNLSDVGPRTYNQ